MMSKRTAEVPGPGDSGVHNGGGLHRRGGLDRHNREVLSARHRPDRADAVGDGDRAGDPTPGREIGGYTRDCAAELGSRCESDTVLATVIRELDTMLPLGLPAWEGGMRALDLGVRRPSASSRSADPREMEGAVHERVHL